MNHVKHALEMLHMNREIALSLFMVVIVTFGVGMIQTASAQAVVPMMKKIGGCRGAMIACLQDPLNSYTYCSNQHSQCMTCSAGGGIPGPGGKCTASIGDATRNVYA